MVSRKELVFRWGLLAALCIVIFCFSGLKADESSEQSGFIVDLIIDTFFYNFKEFSTAKQEALISLLVVIVRKTAHFTEYAVLSALAFCAFVRVRKYLPRYLLAVLFTFVYACSDEFHQCFVPGRAGLFNDVILDTCGGIVGGLAACFIAVFLAVRRILRENSSKSSEI
ncbi:VanZ family protein [Ruminococcus sp.]|uniref:VanZ family protein n=1 Tax=Ruminococcus sp. TaxID=41978 RepID=UPI0025E9C84C|nr:VanZ family protein [Ruminococcus sp.]MBQ8967491.1 VanZ family protein [Ruminococcus sp.]